MGEKKDVWRETPRRGFPTGDALQPRAREGTARDPGTVRHPRGLRETRGAVGDQGGL